MGHASFLQIREAIASGNVSPEKAVERLTKAIEAEYAKPTPDTDFIIACEDLLWELEHPGQPFVSKAERFRAFVAAQPCPTRTARVSRRVVAAAAVLALCLGIGGFRYAWFSHSASDDGQQYVIQGHEVTVEMISSAIAEHKDVSSFQTESWEELIDFLGFVPQTLDGESIGLPETQYIAMCEPASITCYTLYQNKSTNASATFMAKYCLDSEAIRYSLEQDNNGVYEVVGNTKVYISSNIGKLTCSWSDEDAVYQLSGSLTYEDTIDYIETLLEVNN